MPSEALQRLQNVRVNLHIASESTNPYFAAAPTSRVSHAIFPASVTHGNMYAMPRLPRSISSVTRAISPRASPADRKSVV
jgi:hypothetical protein